MERIFNPFTLLITEELDEKWDEEYDRLIEEEDFISSLPIEKVLD